MKKVFTVILFTALVSLTGCNSQTPTVNNVNPEPTKTEEAPAVNLSEIEATTDEGSLASTALISFFDLLSTQKYDQALALFAPKDGWETLENTSPEEEKTDKAKVLANYCQAMGTCLKAAVLETKKGTDDEYLLTVQFQNTDGTTFILGPCCGATEKEMPSKDKFEYVVKKINGNFTVLTPPVYKP